MNDEQSSNRPKKPLLRRIEFWLAALLVFYAVIGFFVVPLIAKKVMIDFMADQFHRPLEIGSLRTNPFTFSATVDDLLLYEPNHDTCLTVKEAFANLNILPVLQRELVCTEVQLESPSVAVRMHQDSTFNFDDILAYIDSLRRSPEPGWSLFVRYLSINGMSISIFDQTTTPPADLHIIDGKMSAWGFHAASPDTTHFTLSCSFSQGGSAQSNGIFIPSARLIDTRMLVEGMSLVPFQPYLSRYAHLEITSGGINTTGD